MPKTRGGKHTVSRCVRINNVCKIVNLESFARRKINSCFYFLTRSSKELFFFLQISELRLGLIGNI